VASRQFEHPAHSRLVQGSSPHLPLCQSAVPRSSRPRAAKAKNRTCSRHPRNRTCFWVCAVSDQLLIWCAAVCTEGKSPVCQGRPVKRDVVWMNGLWADLVTSYKRYLAYTDSDVEWSSGRVVRASRGPAVLNLGSTTMTPQGPHVAVGQFRCSNERPRAVWRAWHLSECLRHQCP